MTYLFDVLCLDGEVWKPIPSYEGLYEASSLGRIRTFEGKHTYTKRHGERTWKQRILKPKGINVRTGFRVSLWNNGNHKDFLVARLIATTFCGNYINTNLTVNHMDGNRFNNNISNLEWLTLGDNIRHAFDTGLMLSTQKPVIVTGITNNKRYEFGSMAEASRTLGHDSGYVSLVLARERNVVYDNLGNKFLVEVG